MTLTSESLSGEKRTKDSDLRGKKNKVEKNNLTKAEDWNFKSSMDYIVKPLKKKNGSQNIEKDSDQGKANTERWASWSLSYLW